MAVLNLDNVSEYKDRHGKVRYRFRKKGQPQIALPGPIGSAAFNEALEAARALTPAELGKDRTRPGSLSAGLVAYYGSAEWRELKPSTARMHRNILERLRSGHGPRDKTPYGDRTLANLTQEAFLAIRDRLSLHAGNNFLKVTRRFFVFAAKRKLMRLDPTATIKATKIKSDGFHCWTEDEISQFEAVHAEGTAPRLALTLLLHTAQRRGDVVRMGRQHVRGDYIEVRQEKTGSALSIPITPELRKAIDLAPKDQLTFLQTGAGRPYSPAFFGNVFRTWCDDAGLPKICTAHGLRKAAATRLADAGCSVHEIAAITGHKSLSEVARYTKSADQKRNATRALSALSGTKKERSVGEPETSVGEPLPQLVEKKG